jgi:hypothetical protein
MDAIHIGNALIIQADVFITTDERQVSRIARGLAGNAV